MCSNFKMRPSWSTLSKAFEKSKSMASICWWFLRQFAKSSTVVRSCDMQLCFFRNPYYASYKTSNFVQMCHYIAVHNMFKNLAGDRSQGNGPIIFGERAVAFLIKGDNVALLPIIWNYSLVQGCLKKDKVEVNHFMSTCFEELGRDVIGAIGFVGV